MREVYEHRPASLQLIVNGELRNALRITSEISELHLTLDHEEVPSYVEVSCEQGISLAYLQVQSPVNAVELEQRSMVKLSDGRSLDLSLSFCGGSPTVRVYYCDPVAAELKDFIGTDEDDWEPALVFHEQTLNDSATTRTFSDSLQTIRQVLDRWLFHSRPALVAALLALPLCVVFYARPRSAPHTNLTVAALLRKAEMSGNQSSSTPLSRVVRQRVRISSPHSRFEKVLYRDPKGLRRPRPSAANAAEASLIAKLSDAEVKPENPLSAASFEEWHTRQVNAVDRIERIDTDKWMLTTTVSGAPVLEQSLTIRADDFHPIARTVRLRDEGLVQIAELSYDVLPWDAEAERSFQPSSLLGPPTEVLHLPVVAKSSRTPLSDAQLDEEELEVWLALDNLHAMTNDRVAVQRTPGGILIKGIVSDEQRKRQIESEIRKTPHTLTAISTFEEIDNRSSEPGTPKAVEQLLLEKVASPLETALKRKAKPDEQISQTYDRLFAGSDMIAQRGKELSNLVGRFPPSVSQTDAVNKVLRQLILRNESALLHGLEDEEAVLREAGPGKPLERIEPDGPMDLAAALKQNAALSSEALSGSASVSRSFEIIGAELHESILQVRAAVQRSTEPYGLPPANSSDIREAVSKR